MKKDLEGIYTIDLAEYKYSKVVWVHPIISVVVAIGLVAVFSFNGIFA